MSDDNGFVERPVHTHSGNKMSMLIKRLAETADNGKAVVFPRASLGNNSLALLRRGLKGHIAKQADGTYVAWCERVETKPAGA
jgi:hypothetical protein